MTPIAADFLAWPRVVPWLPARMVLIVDGAASALSRAETTQLSKMAAWNQGRYKQRVALQITGAASFVQQPHLGFALGEQGFELMVLSAIMGSCLRRLCTALSTTCNGGRALQACLKVFVFSTFSVRHCQQCIASQQGTDNHPHHY